MDIKGYPIKWSDGTDRKFTMASGPVIIENDQVLLVQHGGEGQWKFPGGKMSEDLSMQQRAITEIQEELGIAIELVGKPYLFGFERIKNGQIETIILVHFLAKRLSEVIVPGPEIEEWSWLDINNLPENCHPNVKPAVEYFRK